jgi:YbgC/YbaW family acyl-CoA thioester hydrolase
MPQFVMQRRVQFSETDMAGIVHFANFFRWMEEAEHEFFRSLGVSIVTPLPDGTILGWPRVSCSCNYAAPARYDDLIDVCLDVERIGLRSVSYSVEFQISGSRIANGKMKSACCICATDGSLKSVDLPPNFQSVLKESPFLVRSDGDQATRMTPP